MEKVIKAKRGKNSAVITNSDENKESERDVQLALKILPLRAYTGIRTKTVLGDEFRQHPYIEVLEKRAIVFIDRKREYKVTVKPSRERVQLTLADFIPQARAIPLIVVYPGAFAHDIIIFLEHSEANLEAPFLLAYSQETLTKMITDYFSELMQRNREEIARDALALDFLFQLTHTGKRIKAANREKFVATLLLRELPIADTLKEKLRKLEIYTIADLEEFLMSNQGRLPAVPRLGVSLSEEEFTALVDALCWANRVLRGQKRRK